MNRLLTPYRMVRYDWPSGWYFEWKWNWALVGFALEVSLGNEGPYGYEHGVDLQFGPLYVDGGICVPYRRTADAQSAEAK